MPDWNIGDKVRFVQESGAGWDNSVKDRVYTVLGIDDDITLVEKGHGTHLRGAFHERFVRVDDDLDDLRGVVSRLRAAGYTLEVNVTEPPKTVEGERYSL